MALNIFEGARRIVKLIAVVWVLGWVVAAINVDPNVYVTYKIPGPTEAPAPKRILEECPSDSAKEYKDTVSKNDKRVSIILCFYAATTSDGTRIIPYLRGTYDDIVGEAKEPNPFEEILASEQAKKAQPKFDQPQGNPGATKEQWETIHPAKQQWWGGDKYSSEVTAYTSRVKDSFSIPQADEAWIDAEWQRAYINELGW